MKKSALLLFLFFIVQECIYAGSVSRIKGKVIDAVTKAPIEFADIILSQKETSKVVTHGFSSEKGEFELSEIPVGEYSLLIRLIGYDNFIVSSLPVTSTEVIDFKTIEIKPLEFGLAEVVVEADRKQIIYKLDKKVIDGSSNLMGSGGSAIDILENTPSFRVDAEGDVTFRGSSGFLVYVDGKPSVYSGTAALQQIPAGTIENIEIITTPSARNDTDGDVGIINIITKKNSQEGISGMVNLFGSSVLSNGADFFLTQRKSDLQWSIAGSWNQPIRKSDFNQAKTTIVDDLTTISQSDGPRKGKGYNYYIRNGWLYYLPQTTLNLELEFGYQRRTRKGDLDYTEEKYIGGELVESGNYMSRDFYDLPTHYYQGNMGFDHAFNDKGHKLLGSFLLRYEGDALEYFQSDLYDKQGSRAQGHRAWEDEIRWTVRGNLDYIWPYSSTGKLESGYQYFSYLEDGDYSMQFWSPEKKEFYWRDDIYNTFYFQRGIHSVYLMGSESYKNFDAQVGLRGEHTHQVLGSSIEGADRTVNRFEVFPSVHIGYNLPKDQKLLFAYSYRTTRPQLFYMEPYITYRDYYTAEIGNPDIRPEYINSFELNYKKNIEDHSFSSTLFYRYRKDKIERLRIPFEAGVTLDSMANVGNDKALGLELNAQVKVMKNWNLSVLGNVYHYKVENEYKTEGGNEKSTNYDITVNNVISLGKYTRFQVDGNFVGPSVTTQGRSDSFWYINMAVRQQLLARKLQATLSMRDVFNTARYRSDILTSNLVSRTRIKPQFPLITLSLSYTFNNYSRKTAENRDNRDLFEGTNH